ncbi:type II toxin-antitoxin system HipA family toxin [Halomonas sp. JS92-SW72]|uniref:type II toxin-antitoxin system HipA family toxin n=1 Tax=Halomonas sp. JS92-SW72 TaxID=2306583 RepID=UPI000E5BAB11|nr:type II toxin-antitoxin system HipA family toxin [Halomonas sp. JS92-SW72]AXY44009.1 type II toxin-antitoxin system HipA family toxin [Halomonas sp. JS92-SW72]
MPNLVVAMNGIEVGVLTLARSGAMTFRYLPEWFNRAGARAISLSMPLTLSEYRGEVVYNFFDNLLPDSEDIRARMQVRFQLATRHPFDLLASIGRDCIGAIQLYPESSMLESVRQVTAEPVSDQDIEGLLIGYREAPLGMSQQSEFRISLAGAQEKTALLWYEGRWQRPSGSTPTSHILKLPIGFLEHSNIDLRQSGENEWLCLQILAAFGLPVAKAALATFGTQTVLVVERFDRRWSGRGDWLMRLPQEDFCQALGVAPALKYESDGGPGIADAMRLLLGSQEAGNDRKRFFYTQMLFWLLAAIDGHAKNFSLFLEPGSAYRMTPLYDVISAYPLMAHGSLPRERATMAMALKGKSRHYRWARIEPRHFFSSAAQVGFPQERVRELMQDIAARAEGIVEDLAGRLPPEFPSSTCEPIFTGVLAQAERLGASLA